MEHLISTVAAWAGDNLLQVVLSAVAVFLIPVARHYAAMMKSAFVRNAINGVINHVEELARQRAGTGQPLVGEEKLEMGIRLALNRIPGIDAAEAEQLIHEQLPAVRAALGDFSKATLNAALTSPSTAPQN